jgi:TolB-like protein
MKKKVLLYILLALCLSGTLYGKERIPVAVLDLTANGVPDFYGRAVADMMITELKKYDDVQLIERNQVELILKEQETQKKCSSSDCAVQMGRLLSAKKILIGSITKMGRLYMINGKVIDVEKGSVDFVESGRCTDEEDIEVAARVCAVKLVNRMTGNNYALPASELKHDGLRSRFSIYMGGRFGYIPGLNNYMVKGAWPDYVLSDTKKNAYVAGGMLRPSYEINRFFAVQLDFRYMHIETVRDANKWSQEIGDSSGTTRVANGFGTFVGMRAHYQIGGFMPYVSCSIGYNRLYYREEKAYWFSLWNYSDFSNGRYKVIIDEINNYCSTEFELGCFAYLSRYVELALSIGVEVPLAAEFFHKSRINLESYNITQPNIRNSYKGNFPPAYYAQLGFNFRGF